MKRTFASLALWLAVALGATAQTLSFPGAANAKIGIVVRDLLTGIDLVSQNADASLTPASILKCVTAASVLADDKADYRFQTIAYTTGRITDEGVVEGNLAIRGVGDPTTDSEYFPEYSGMADSIAVNLTRMGINRIAGVIEIDSSAFPDPGPGKLWEAEDLGYSYGAGLYAINFKDNTIGTGKADRNPGRTFVNALHRALATQGIAVDGAADIDHAALINPVYTHFSPSAAEILRVTLEFSNNLFAESMLRILAPGQNLDQALMQELMLQAELGLDVDKTTIHDGSGLTRDNRVTPRYMADLLQTMAYRPDVARYTSFFPLAGQEGTVKKLLADTYLEGRLALKSGSMRGVQCYAGYKLNENGSPTHAVVVIVNGFTTQAAKVRNAIGDFLLEQFADEAPLFDVPL